MAKKDKLKTNQNIFDDDLNLPDFDFDLKPPKDDRKPVIKVLDGVKEGLKNSVTTPGKIQDALKKILPDGYGEAIDLKDQTVDTIKKLYDNTAKEIKPSVKDMTRAVDKILPESAKKTKSLLSKIDKWASDNGYNSNAAADKKAGEDYEVASQIGSIFKFQMEQDVKKEEEKSNREIIREGLAVDRHKDQLGLLNTINIGINTLAQYQNKVTAGYQKKTLELSYRKYFLMGDMLEEMKASNEQKRLALKDIVKNTALPEIVKTRMSEQFHDFAKNKFVSGVSNGVSNMLFGENSTIMNKLKEGMLKTMKGYAQDAANAISMGAFGAEMVGIHQEYGGDTHKTIGTIAGNKLGDWAQDNIFSKAKGFLDKHEALRHGGKKLSHIVRNFPQHIIEKAQNWAQKDGIRGVIGQFGVDSSRGMAPDSKVHVDNLSNLHGPSIFTSLASKSITEIIPGYLARIFRELQITRTGDEGTQLTKYDVTKNAFSDVKTVAKNLMNTIISPENKKRANSDLETLIDKIDPQGKLTPKAREALKAQILRDKLSGKVVVDAERYADARNLSHPDIQSHAKLISKTVEKHLSSGTAEQRTDKNNAFNQGSKWLHQSITDPRANIQHMLNAGQHDFLEEAGLLIKDVNGETSIDIPKFIKMYVGGDSPGNDAPGKTTTPRKPRSPRSPKAVPHKKEIKPSRRKTVVEDELTGDENMYDLLMREMRLDEEHEANKTTRIRTKAVKPTVKPRATRKTVKVVEKPKAVTKVKVKTPTKRVYKSRSSKSQISEDEILAEEESDQEHVKTKKARTSRPKTKTTEETKLTPQEESNARVRRMARIKGGGSQSGFINIDAILNFITGKKPVTNLETTNKASKTRKSGSKALESEILADLEKLYSADENTKKSVFQRLKNIFSETRDKITKKVKDFKDDHFPDHLENQQHGDKKATKSKVHADPLNRIADNTLKTVEQLEVIEALLKHGVGLGTGSGSNENGEEATNSWFKLTGRRIKSLGTSAASKGWKAAKAINSIGNSTVGAAYRAGKTVVTKSVETINEVMKNMGDVYFKNEVLPRLSEAKMKAGAYIDKKTGKVISKINDIKGAIIDKETGKIVLRASELKDIIVKTNVWSKGYEVGKKLVSGDFRTATDIFNFGNTITVNAIKLAKKVGTNVISSVTNFLDGPGDVYVKSDMENPKLTEIAMKAGLYFSRKTGNVIKKMSDIDGPVETRKGKRTKIVLTEDDLKAGICDSKGEPIRGLWDKVIHKGAAFIGKTIGKITKTAGAALAGIKKAFGLAGDGVLGVLQAFADSTGLGIGTWGKKNTETLEKIYSLLDERIPKPKKVLGDAGDGLREGSWQEDQKEEQKGESPDKLSRIKNKAKGVGSAIKGAIADKVLGKKEKKEEGEKEGGVLDTAEGTVAGEMAAKGLDKFGKPLVKGAWNTTKALAKSGAGKLLKYGAIGAEALAGTAAGSAVLGGLGTAGAAIASGAATAGTAIAGGAAAAGTAAAGMAGTALAATGTALAGAATAVGAVLSAPVVLGVLAAAAIGVGGYLLYKHFKKGATDDPMTQYRLAQYGFTSHDEDVAQKVLQLEEMMTKQVKYIEGKATLDDKGFKPNEMMKLFGIKEDDTEMLSKWADWFQNRFKPVFLTSLTAINTKLNDGKEDSGAGKDRTLSDIKDLTPQEKIKYLSLTPCGSSVYGNMTSPFPEIKYLQVGPSMVDRAYKMVKAALEKEAKDKPGVKNDIMDKSKVGAAALAAEATADSKDKADEVKKDNSLGGKIKDILGKTGTVLGYTPGGMLLKAVGSAISFVGKKIDKFAGGQVDALQAIRFRAYGLKEMDRQKVNNLRYLETIVAKGFSGDPQQGTPKWKGSPEDVLKEVSTAFGVIQTDDKGVKAWLKWFTDRFLPVYTLYRGLLLSIVGKPDQDAAEMALKPETTLAVAEKLAATDVWGKSTSPWFDYELNTNSDGVKENLEDLRSKSKKETTLPEAKANATTVATTDKPPVKTPVDNALKNVTPEAAPKAAEGPQTNADGTSTANKDPNLINASYNPNGSSDKSTNTPAYNGRAGGVDPSTLGNKNASGSVPVNTAESHGVDPATLGSKGKFTGSSQDFWNKMHEALLGEAKKAGVASPEAVAALGATQSSLETGYGKHTAGGNNYFGIKAKPGDPGAGSVATQEFIGGKMVTINDKFRKYNNMEESAADYIKFLQENKRYRAILSAKSPEEAIMLQAKSGYATDPGYFNKLQGIYSKFSGTTGTASHGVDPTTLSKKPDDAIAPRTNTAASHGVDPATLGKKTVPGGVVSSDGTPVTSGDGSPVSSGSSNDATIKPVAKPSLTPAPSSIGSIDTTIPIKQAPTFSSAIRNNNVPNNVFAQTNTAPPVSQKQPLDIGPDIKSIDSTLTETLSVDKDSNSVLKSLLKEVIAIANKLAADDKATASDTTTTSSPTPRQSAPAPTLPVFVGRMA